MLNDADIEEVVDGVVELTNNEEYRALLEVCKWLEAELGDGSIMTIPLPAPRK